MDTREAGGRLKDSAPAPAVAGSVAKDKAASGGGTAQDDAVA